MTHTLHLPVNQVQNPEKSTPKLLSPPAKMLRAGTRTQLGACSLHTQEDLVYSQNTGKTQGTVAHTYNPRAGEVETESPGLAGLVEQANHQLDRNSVSKNRWTAPP